MYRLAGGTLSRFAAAMKPIVQKSRIMH